MKKGSGSIYYWGVRLVGGDRKGERNYNLSFWLTSHAAMVFERAVYSRKV